MKTISPFFLLAATLATLASARADVRLPAIFGDHMVLQQDATLPVWGWADAGEEVTVTLGQGPAAKTTAAADGSWRVNLKPVPSSNEPTTLTVAGRNTVTFQDVLVGEVWVCSGQSNMAWSVWGADGGAEEAKTARDPLMRIFLAERAKSIKPETDITGKWVPLGPDTTGNFSAVAYFFGRDLRKTLQRPVGLIGTYVGGTPAQAWISLPSLQKDPPFSMYIDQAARVRESYEKTSVEYPALKTKYDEEQKQWQTEVGTPYEAAMKDWQAAVEKARAEGTSAPERPEPSRRAPNPPAEPDGGWGYPGNLFNAMIAPLIPYAIKGVIWYQGESNGFQADLATEYKTLFPRLITDWREKWGGGDFPFLFVQLSSFKEPQKEPSETVAAGLAWPLLREAQFQTLSLPNTGMATTIDIGDVTDIHPKDKLDVGLRLARAARHIAYGENLVYSGPLYDSFQVEGNKIRLKFRQAGSGLAIGVAPWPAGLKPGSELTGFAIAGEDQKWLWARAQINGDSVVVWNDAITTPAAVRYGWANHPTANLYNKEGLPASPFRTDDWKN